MTVTISCPSCGMSASILDERQLVPVLNDDGSDLRMCRNCGAMLDLVDESVALVA